MFIEASRTSQLHAIAKTITNRQNLRPQLRMVDEVPVKFAQCFRRCSLIRRTNLTRYLAGPKKIVADNYATRTQLRQSQIEVTAILFFHRIEKDEIECFIKTRNYFESVSLFDPGALTQTGSGQITLRGVDHFVARLHCY